MKCIGYCKDCGCKIEKHSLMFGLLPFVVGIEYKDGLFRCYDCKDLYFYYKKKQRNTEMIINECE